MANTTAPRPIGNATYSGWFYDAVTPEMKFYNRGTLVFSVATDAVTAAGTFASDGALTVTGDMTISGDANIAGIPYTWPANDGDSGQQLETNGSGILTWEAAV